MICRNMVCSKWNAKTYQNKVSVSMLVLFLCCTCNSFLKLYLVSYRLEILFTKCVPLNGRKKTSIFIELLWKTAIDSGKLNVMNIKNEVKCNEDKYKAKCNEYKNKVKYNEYKNKV